MAASPASPSSLRNYQRQLFEAAACAGNHIVVLPTGAGKTLVSVELAMRAIEVFPQRTVVYLAPTVALIGQQHGVFVREAGRRRVAHPEQIGLCHGGRKAPAAGRLKALFATPAKFLQLLESNGMQWVSLLVLDECHHAASAIGRTRFRGHPYTIIADKYRREPGHARPKVLGLTASPGECRAGMEQLSEAFSATILHTRPGTPEAEELARHVAEPALRTVLPRGELELSAASALQDFLSEMAVCQRDFQRTQSAAPHLNEESEEGPNNISKAVELAARARCMGWFHSTGSAFDGMASCWMGLQDHAAVQVPPFSELWLRLRQRSIGAGAEMPFASPLFLRLLSTLERSKAKAAQHAGGFRAIVFVETRRAALDLRHVLARVAQRRADLAWLRPAVLLGHNKRTSFDADEEEARFTAARQQVELTDFAEGRTNVLVATSVAEEGIDIQACSLVVRMEPATAVIKHIQSRGRARRQASEYAVLCLHSDEERGIRDTAQREVQVRADLASLAPKEPAENNWTCAAPRDFDEGRERSPRRDGRVSFGRAGGEAYPSFLHVGDGTSDYKSKLNLLMQQGLCRSVRYEMVRREGPAHCPRFVSAVDVNGLTFEGQAMARVKDSEQSAAFRALRGLGLLRR